jgi:hypothetical protein
MISNIFTVAGVGVGIAIVIAIAILFPLLVIWALNTLFPILAIPYSLETWSAIVLLQIFIKSKIEVNKTK